MAYRRNRKTVFRPRNIKTLFGATPTSFGKAKLALNAFKAYAVKRKSKRAGRTATRGRTPFNNVKVEGSGGQLTRFSASNPSSPAIKAMMKVNASNYLYFNNGYRLTCAAGYTVLHSYGICTAGTYLAAASNETYANDLGAIQYRINGAATNANAKTGRYAVLSAFATYKITNQDQGNVEVYIYDVATKKDTTQAPIDTFIGGLNDQTSGSYTTTTLPVGVHPKQSSYFNQMYKVKQTTRIILGQGQSHSHIISLKPHKMFHSEILTENNLSLAGWTMWTMISASGLPANDITTKTSATVSTGQVALDVVATKQIRYTWSSDLGYNTLITDNLPHSFAVGEDIINIGSGAAGADNVA